MMLAGGLSEFSNGGATAPLPIQDPDKRERLAHVLGEKRLAELLALVPGEVGKVVDVISKIQASDKAPTPEMLADLEREAHGVRGMALNYGLMRLASAAAAVQDYCRTRGDIDLHLRRLHECSGEVADLMDQ